MDGSPSSDLQELPEKPLPKASLRFLLLLIAASAVVMVIFRAALVQQQMWAKVIAMMLSAWGMCFLLYALLFSVVNLFAATTRPLRAPSDFRETNHFREKELPDDVGNQR